MPSTPSSSIYWRGALQPSWHWLRHWFATEIYVQGHDIRVTQELLGHSDPSTTAEYIAYSHVDAAAAVRSLSFGSTRGPD